jgi:N-acetylglucosamine kinase-like BadF-type ATPase
MSTTADVLPYMQSWLDARAAQGPLVAAFNTATTTMATAYSAIAARVAAGDTAAQMSALVTTYVAAKTDYLAKDILQRTAKELTQGRFAAFQQMVDLLAAGEDVPPFSAGP